MLVEALRYDFGDLGVGRRRNKRVDEKKRSEKQSERFVLGKERIRECFNVRDRRRIFVLKAQADLWCLLLWLVVADLGFMCVLWYKTIRSIGHAPPP